MPRPFLTADWRHLVMMNYEIDPAILQPYIPLGVHLDTWRGRHFISIVGFMFHHTKVMGIPVPFHRTFPEVNLRFYVRRTTNGERRRGVVFIREVAPRRVVCMVARTVYNEPYVYCRMSHTLHPPIDGVGRVSYGWHWPGGEIRTTAEFTGDPHIPEPESLTAFIAEHYWAYTRQRKGGTSEYPVTHPPWRIWEAKSHLLHGDAVGFYGPGFANVLDRPPLLAFIAEGSPVAVFPGRRLPV